MKPITYLIRRDEDGTFGPTYTEHGNPVTYFVRDHHDGTYGIVSDVTGHVITNNAGSFELAIQGALAASDADAVNHSFAFTHKTQ